MTRAFILEHRRRKDEFFRSSPNSPIPLLLRANFAGLTYFDDVPAFVQTIRLEPDLDGTVLVLRTSSGSERTYQRVGWLQMRVHDDEVIRLAAFTDEGNCLPKVLFIPFRDSTNGNESYGAGRYVEAAFDGVMAEIDLNLAYNPTCAYSDGWACPIPPPENHFNLPIRAGESAFKFEDHA